MTTAAMESRRSDATLRMIGSFKLAKGLLLIVLGLAAQRLIHEGDITETMKSWAIDLHLRPEGRFIGRVLQKVSGLHPDTLRHASAGIFAYAALLVTEGCGLLLRQRWAEYFTIIVTGSFIPLEVYEAVRRVTFTRAAITAVNALVVGYLVLRLRREHLTATSGRPPRVRQGA